MRPAATDVSPIVHHDHDLVPTTADTQRPTSPSDLRGRITLPDLDQIDALPCRARHEAPPGDRGQRPASVRDIPANWCRSVTRQKRFRDRERGITLGDEAGYRGQLTARSVRAASRGKRREIAETHPQVDHAQARDRPASEVVPQQDLHERQ